MTIDPSRIHGPFHRKSPYLRKVYDLNGAATVFHVSEEKKIAIKGKAEKEEKIGPDKVGSI